MFQDYIYITSLALKDIGHEKVLSLCMVCSLGAIFTPIIILLGLQQGIIGNMLDTLNSDPASRLVRPKFITQSPIPEEKLQIIKQEGSVFIHSETSHLLLEVEGMSDSVNVVPASAEDPFVLFSNTTLSGEDKWVVISESLSRKINKHAGEDLTLLLNRVTDNSGAEVVPFSLKITGVIEHNMMPELKVYLSEEVFNGVYQWRKGYAVPELDLQGSRAHTFSPEYDGVLTGFTLKSPKDQEYRQMLAGRLPFSTMPVLYNNIQNSVGTEWYLWRTINSTLTTDDINILENTLLNYGYAPHLIPFINAMEFGLSVGDSNVKLDMVSMEKEYSPIWNIKDKPVFYVSKAEEIYVGERKLTFKTGMLNQETKIPAIIKVSDKVAPGKIVTSHYFMGVLRAAQRIGAVYDDSSSSFVINGIDQIRYFRVYSESIEKLESLVNSVKRVGEELGVTALKEPVSRINEVQRIRTLSDYMERIYFLIAAISGVSTIFAVTASVYATVQRRKRDLAYLNMLGLDKSTIIFFPFIKSIILIIGGVAIAFMAYWMFGYLASHWFIDLLGETESLTRLNTENVVGVVTTILFLGGISSLTAGSLVNRIDPKRYTNE